MDYSKIRINLEKQFADELNQLIQGDIIHQILELAKIEETKNYHKNAFDGHHFKVSKKLSPKLNDLCNKSLESLEFDEKVDFYIINQPDVNAFAIPKLEDTHDHIIGLNSALIKLLDDEELKYVIGHELGHIISKNAEIWRIIRFVFPDGDRVPLILRNKIMFWQRLSELSADRFGFITCPNIKKVVSSFFKMAAGIPTDRIKFNHLEYLEQNEKILAEFRKDDTLSTSSHPINPLRLKSLKLFSESELYGSLIKKTSASDTNLSKSIEELLGDFTLLADSELEIHRMYFIASSGIIVALLDKKFDKKEYDEIISTTARFTLFPRNLLDNLMKSDNIHEVFEKSALSILTQNPSERYPMFEYLINIALSDNVIFDKEINWLFEIGEKLFKFSQKETAQLIADSINKSFIPKLF